MNLTPEIWQTVLLVMGSSGIGGLVIGIYNAWVSARKGTLDEWRGLLAEQREVIDNQKKIIEEQSKEILEQKRQIEDLKDWAERLLRQLARHAPQVEAEKFIRRDPL